MLRLGEAADCFLCEAGADENSPETKHHLSPSQAVETAVKAKAQKLLLTHYHPENKDSIASFTDKATAIRQTQAQVCEIMGSYTF